MQVSLWITGTYLVLLLLALPLKAEELKTNTAVSPSTSALYSVQPGDVLDIMVWKEDQLQLEVLVRPDGFISFPLVGEVMVKGKTFPQIQELIADRLRKYIAEPLVSVSAKQLINKKIFVMGKVNKPGEYVIDRTIDVVQALALAGGLTAFASPNDIKILRRDNLGNQQTLTFRYGDVEEGQIRQNIVLQSGDSVVVP